MLDKSEHWKSLDVRSVPTLRHRTIGACLMPSGRISRICTYTYPGLTISFDNGLLLRIDVTRPQWNFRLPIRVGDPEQRVYELFGKPGWQYEYDGMRQIDYALTGRLSVYIREGKVSRIIWGVG